MRFLYKINPLSKLILSLFILIFSLININPISLSIYMCILLLLICMEGLWEEIRKGLFMAILFSLIVSGLSYLFGTEIKYAVACGYRFIFIYLSYVIFYYTTDLSDFVRALYILKIPMIINIGVMITIRFVPILKRELKRINDSFKIRMRGRKASIAIRYRALVIPMVFRMITISDDLTLAIQMRGFEGGNYNPYRTIKINMIDYMFVLINTIIMVALICIF